MTSYNIQQMATDKLIVIYYLIIIDQNPLARQMF